MSLLIVSLATLAHAVDLEFPRSTSKIYNTFGAPVSLGAGGGGVLFVSGSWVGDKFASTGLTSVSSADMDFDMSDFTNMACVVGTLDFDVEINGVVVGAFSWAGGFGVGTFNITQSYAFAPVAGGGPTGDGYRVRIISRDTVCGGGGSYNYFPGGLLTLL